MKLGYWMLAAGSAVLTSACGSSNDASTPNNGATTGATGTGPQAAAGMTTMSTGGTAGSTPTNPTAMQAGTAGTPSTTTGGANASGAPAMAGQPPAMGGAAGTAAGAPPAAGGAATAGTPPAMGGGGAAGEPPAAGGAAMMAGAAGMMGEPGGMGGADTGPPADAYEPCSGAAVPSLTLTSVLENLDSPLFATTPASDASTMYVVERTGGLLRANLNDGSTTQLLDLNTSTDAECGFLSIALHPNFDGVGENRIWVSYNPSCPAQIFGSGGSSTLVEYTIDGDTATPGQVLFEFDQPEGNHNGGCLAFGPDGYLYYSLGDGGGANDQHGTNGNAQNVGVPLGKILRFDVDNVGTPPSGNLTSADVGGADVDGRIFHYGLRNPWRFSFDRATGDLYIGDVGQDTEEEVSFAPAGSGPLNFGWSAREGMGACGACGHSLLAGTTATDPIISYPTANGGGGLFQGSVTGGYVYRGSAIPGLYGRYIYADYVRGDIMALTYDGSGGTCDEVDELIPGANIPGESLSSFAQDANGEVYVINMARGNILRIDPQ